MNLQRRFLLATLGVAMITGPAHAQSGAPVAHWKLAGDARDASGNANHGTNHGVDFRSADAAGFDGRKAHLEIPDSPSLQLGTGDFSVALWVHTEEKLDDVLGDLVSKYEPATRTGFNLSIQNFAGVASAQSNYRHVHFGIDAAKIDPQWTDFGRPGNNLMIFALCVYQGQLYAGTFEFGADESGHVYRYDGGSRWVDCGSPVPCNAVQALAVYDGKLYAGAGRYLSRGSALDESPNERPGGRVYRYEGGTQWTDCGALSNPETGDSFTVGGMAVYNGKLYAGVSKPAGRGLYRYDAAQQWTYLGNPGHRVTNPVVYNGKLYLASLDGGGVTRYDGPGKFADCGRPEGVTQTYGFAVYRGDLYTSSWPNGEVFRYDGGKTWTSAGRLGEEKEVMGMAVYNGKLYGGTLPLAAVYRYEGGTQWTGTGRLDTTPDVRYRRVWSMAVHRGKLFCGTLPSGHVYSIEAGKSVTYDHALPPGWVHLAAVRKAGRLLLYVGGTLVARSTAFDADRYSISNTRPLEIGFGAHDSFNGSMRDVRIYRRALTGEELRTFVEPTRPEGPEGA